MFDLRYHVASLAAVFLALIIGILVGAGLAARTDVEGSERAVLEGEIADLRQQSTDLTAEADLLRRQGAAAQTYIDQTYDALMNGRLRATRVAMLVLGPLDDGVVTATEQTLEDASAAGLVELEALGLPVRAEDVMAALEPPLAGLSMEEVGRRLGEELVEGGETPLWTALTPVIVQDHRGDPSGEVDAVVVSHTGAATDSATSDLLDGLYAGLTATDVPVVGVERTDSGEPSRIAIYKAKRISSVDCVDTQLGRVGLASLLAGATGGHYGLKRSAEDGAVPDVEPLPLAPLPGG
jgi:Copper transport outer membrane protein, MctB